MNENIVKIIFNFVLKTSGLKVKFWIIFAFFGGEGRDGFDTDNIKVLLLKKKKKTSWFSWNVRSYEEGWGKGSWFQTLAENDFFFFSLLLLHLLQQLCYFRPLSHSACRFQHTLLVSPQFVAAVLFAFNQHSSFSLFCLVSSLSALGSVNTFTIYFTPCCNLRQYLYN